MSSDKPLRVYALPSSGGESARQRSPTSCIPDKQFLLTLSAFWCQVLLTDCNNIVILVYITKQTREKTMYTTVNENGVLNNYAPVPQVYCAEYPAIWEQRNYVIQGAVAAMFVTALVLVAFAVS